MTPLLMASKSDMMEGVDYLVREGKANVNTTDNKGWTALHHACERDNLKMVRFLLTCGNANVERRDKKGMTALLIASQYSPSGRISQYLVENKANVEARDNSGKTALHYACENIAFYDGSLTLVEFLVTTGQATVEIDTTLGRKTLQCARMLFVRYGRLGLAHCLVEAWQF